MHPYDDPEALLKLSYVADLVGVTPEYLAQQIRLGRLAAYRIGREWRISRAHLADWLHMVESRSKVA